MELKEFYNNKNVLVTGGAGFIGSHLVEKLVELGARVTVFDNFSSGSLNNLRNVLPFISVTCADIRSAHSIARATQRKDIVFHHAAFISVPLSLEQPELCNAVNTQGTRNVLEGCIQNDVKSFVFASSSAVYGNSAKINTEEDPVNPLTPYAVSKIDGENLCKTYAQKSSLSSACLRYFNVYGERQRANGEYAAVVAKFKENLLNQKPITIFGTGMQTRDFIPVQDAVMANLKVAMIPDLKGEIFNIGSGKSTNLLELLAQLESDLKVQRAGITFAPARSDDIFYSCASCEKYKNKVK